MCLDETAFAVIKSYFYCDNLDITSRHIALFFFVDLHTEKPVQKPILSDALFSHR